MNEPAKYLREFRGKKGKAYVQACSAKRRAIGKISTEVVQEVYEDNIKEYGTLTCYLCLNPIVFGQDALEHKVPISKGGTNLRSNLNVSHRSCNSRKSDMSLEKYKEKYY